MNDTPPIIAVGMVDITDENLGMNESIIANTAAIQITLGSYTLERSRTHVFSPYEVLAGPPIAPANAVATPSPISVL